MKTAGVIVQISATIGMALLIAAVLTASSTAMPPHPDLIAGMKQGRIEIPYYLLHKAALRASGVDAGSKSGPSSDRVYAKSQISGNYKILTLLVDFSDNTATVVPADFDTLIYVDVNGSVNNFYRENSYNNLSIVSPVFPSSLGWYRAPQTYAYYVNGVNGLGSHPQNAQGLVEDLVDLADPYVNFAQFDNDGDQIVDGLIVVHAGPGAEFTGNNNDIWSHQWSITPRYVDNVWVSTYSINPEYWSVPGDITLGVYSHELGHVLGLPDLYDTDYTSRGVGNWSLMAGGSWNGVNGSSPSHFDAWSRIFLGFASPIVQTYDQNGVSIPRVETSPTIFKLWTAGFPGSEYFLVENRQKTGYDSYLPSDGLLIWHIDENREDNNSEWWPGSGLSGHYKVALEQADNLWDLEQDTDGGDLGDPHPGITANRNFSGSSSPSSDSYAGTGTLVSVVNISNSGAVMTADLAVGTPQDVRQENLPLPEIRFLGNAPNPFNPVTMIELEVGTQVSVKVEIYNLTGQKVKVLADDYMMPGNYRIFWDGKDSAENDVSSGVYFCRLSANDFSESIKMLKLK